MHWLELTKRAKDKEMLDRVERAIKFGVNINMTDDAGNNALMIHIATSPMAYNEALVNMLITNGIDINAVNKRYDAVIHIVASRAIHGPNMLILLRKLLNAGADFSMQNSKGEDVFDILYYYHNGGLDLIYKAITAGCLSANYTADALIKRPHIMAEFDFDSHPLLEAVKVAVILKTGEEFVDYFY